MEELGVILNNLERLTRLNRSLLLLSKIENRQFADLETVDLNLLLKQVITEINDLAQHHEIKVNLAEETQLRYDMSKDLARILLTNLLKNAILHSPSGSSVKVEISRGSISFSNPGSAALEQTTLYSRFQAGKREHSTGLGLAISKAIADKYNLQLSYNFLKMKHIFRIKL